MASRVRGAAYGMALLVFMVACGHYTRTVPSGSADPISRSGRYVFDSLDLGPHNTDSTLVLIAMSGGGTRAAALSYGVLASLASIRRENSSGTLLDEVDLVSSVSGGSFPAAWLALHGRDSLSAFPDRFLFWNAQRSLLRRAVVPGVFRLPSRNFSRIDVAEAAWNERLFKGTTFDTLVARRRRPYVILNGTDYSTGEQFSFVSETFDAMCADLGKVPLARAVAASSAFPGLLNPISLRNYGGQCPYRPPVWAEQMVRTDRREVPATDRMRWRAAQQLYSLHTPSVRRYMHIMDGGVSDNVGVIPIIRALREPDIENSVRRRLNLPEYGVRRVLVIAVNARTAKAPANDTLSNPPSLANVVDAAATRPMNRLTTESLDLLYEYAQFNKSMLKKCGDPSVPCSAAERIPVFVVEVAFDKLKDPREKQAFLDLPTNFGLPRRTVDELVEIGGRILQEEQEFRDFLVHWRRGG